MPRCYASSLVKCVCISSFSAVAYCNTSPPSTVSFSSSIMWWFIFILYQQNHIFSSSTWFFSFPLVILHDSYLHQLHLWSFLLDHLHLCTVWPLPALLYSPSPPSRPVITSFLLNSSHSLLFYFTSCTRNNLFFSAAAVRYIFAYAAVRYTLCLFVLSY